MTTDPTRTPQRQVSRQAFLRGAIGALAAGAMFGTPRSAADPAGSWESLASSNGGSVLLPANGAQFSTAKQVFNSLYNGSNPAAVVTRSTAADRDTWGMVDLSVGSGQANCHVLATCPAGAGSGVAEAIKSAVGVAPSSVQNKTISHMDLVMYLAGGSSTSSPRGFVAGSDVVPTVNSAAAHAIATAIGEWPAANGQASVIVEPLGGAVSDVAPGDSAFPWRRESAVVQWYVEPSSAMVPTATKWLSSAHQAVQQFSAGGYVNYVEANTTAARYFGSNLARLSSVRQKYDPNQIMFSGLNF